MSEHPPAATGATPPKTPPSREAAPPREPVPAAETAPEAAGAPAAGAAPGAAPASAAGAAAGAAPASAAPRRAGGPGRTARAGAAKKAAPAARKPAPPARKAAASAREAAPAAKPDAGLVRRARRINRELAEVYPYAHPELDFENPFQLLIATVLSAQTTDLRVNQTTPALFARYPTPEDMAAADPEAMEAILRPTGFFRAKTKSVIGLSAALRDRFGGEVPGRLEDLVTLPGVGRKTANVVLGNAFGVPGLTVDTHFGRLVRRFHWTSSEDPEKVESEIAALFPKADWTMLSHRLIFHGRRICHARKPACGACPIAPLCPSYGEGETDPAKAEKLLKYEKAGAPGQRLNPPADFPGPAARPLEAS